MSWIIEKMSKLVPIVTTLELSKFQGKQQSRIVSIQNSPRTKSLSIKNWWKKSGWWSRKNRVCISWKLKTNSFFGISTYQIFHPRNKKNDFWINFFISSKSWTFPNATLIEQIKPVVMEKYEFGDENSTTFQAFWRCSLKQEVKTVGMENYELEYGRKSKLKQLIAVVWNIRIIKIPRRNRKSMLPSITISLRLNFFILRHWYRN